MVPSFTPNVGADGLATDVPIISYTEQVLQEKELKLKQYIQDNYSKIRNVEKELANLALEVKLTAGPKKLALEHLRKKIEISTEKVKAAKVKEQQARKGWEVAERALQAEEAYKQSLCDDLNRLVQESAAAQYTRLEDLTKRLEALNPELKETSAQHFPVDKSTGNSSQQADSLHTQQSTSADKTVGNLGSEHRPQRSFDNFNIKPTSTSLATNREKSGAVQVKLEPNTKHRGNRTSMSAVQARGALVLQKSNPKGAGGWTGAGFDVNDDSASI